MEIAAPMAELKRAMAYTRPFILGGERVYDELVRSDINKQFANGRNTNRSKLPPERNGRVLFALARVLPARGGGIDPRLDDGSEDTSNRGK